MKIVLCGFMGCGKSCIGWRLSKILNWEFADVDSYIENKTAMTVSEIFAQRGEVEFRKMETEAVGELLQKENIIIASGGGLVMNPVNVDLIHKLGGVILFLDVPLAALQERLKNDKKRPLLQKPNRREVIEELFNQRYEKYLNASDVRVHAGAPAIWLARRLAEKINNGESFYGKELIL